MLSIIITRTFSLEVWKPSVLQTDKFLLGLAFRKSCCAWAAASAHKEARLPSWTEKSASRPKITLGVCFKSWP